MLIVREALAEGVAALAAAGMENPGLDASLLLAESLGVSRSSLVAASADPLDAQALAVFRGFVQRRLSGECTAYILGRKEFYGLEFMVNPSVLVPRPDTEILVEKTLEAIKGTESGGQARVLDLCTGSGAVAVALKHTMPELELWATDISAEALEVAQGNAVRLLPPDAIHFCRGDLYAALSFFMPHSFLIITGNPPYIPSADIPGLSPEVRSEPHLALDGGADGLDIIRRLVSRAPEFLCPGGTVLLEADPRQMSTIACLLQERGFTGIQIHRDLSGAQRVIGGMYG